MAVTNPDDQRGAPDLYDRLAHLYLLQLLLVHLFRHAMTGGRGHVRQGVAGGQRCDQVLYSEDGAIGVHLDLGVVALVGQRPQLGDLDLEALGGHLQETSGGAGAYAAHGEVVRNAVTHGDGLVVHAPDVDDGGLALLLVRPAIRLLWN